MTVMRGRMVVGLGWVGGLEKLATVGEGARSTLKDEATLGVAAKLVEAREARTQEDDRRSGCIFGGRDNSILQRWVAAGRLAQLLKMALQLVGGLADEVGSVDQRGDITDKAGKIAALPLPSADPADRTTKLRERRLDGMEISPLGVIPELDALILGARKSRADSSRWRIGMPRACQYLQRIAQFSRCGHESKTEPAGTVSATSARVATMASAGSSMPKLRAEETTDSPTTRMPPGIMRSMSRNFARK